MSSAKIDIHQWDQENFQLPYPHQLTGLNVADGAMIAIYFGILCYATHNTCRYLFKHKGYKNNFSLGIYIFTFIALINRML